MLILTCFRTLYDWFLTYFSLKSRHFNAFFFKIAPLWRIFRQNRAIINKSAIFNQSHRVPTANSTIRLTDSTTFKENPSISPLSKISFSLQIRQWPVVMRLADVGLAGYHSAGINKTLKTPSLLSATHGFMVFSTYSGKRYSWKTKPFILNQTSSCWCRTRKG